MHISRKNKHSVGNLLLNAEQQQLFRPGKETVPFAGFCLQFLVFNSHPNMGVATTSLVG